MKNERTKYQQSYPDQLVNYKVMILDNDKVIKANPKAKAIYQ